MTGRGSDASNAGTGTSVIRLPVAHEKAADEGRAIVPVLAFSCFRPAAGGPAGEEMADPHSA
jgi:hypothetical protein